MTAKGDAHVPFFPTSKVIGGQCPHSSIVSPKDPIAAEPRVHCVTLGRPLPLLGLFAYLLAKGLLSPLPS